MSEHQQDPWVERNWYWLVITFGILFIACIDFFAPVV